MNKFKIQDLTPNSRHAYNNGAYSQKEIADHFEMHYSTVSKIIKKLENNKKEKEI